MTGKILLQRLVSGSISFNCHDSKGKNVLTFVAVNIILFSKESCDSKLMSQETRPTPEEEPSLNKKINQDFKSLLF